MEASGQRQSCKVAFAYRPWKKGPAPVSEALMGVPLCANRVASLRARHGASVEPGELHRLLDKCRGDDARAWETFAAWVTTRGRSVLAAIRGLSAADRQDAVAAALQSLVTAVRRDGINGQSNAEIDAYVCASIRNRALNVLRSQARRHDAGELTPAPGDSARGDVPLPEAADPATGQDARLVAAEQLKRAEELLLSWAPADQYVFLAKLQGVPTDVIRDTLKEPPFGVFTASSTIDTKFHRLRERLARRLSSHD